MTQAAYEMLATEKEGSENMKCLGNHSNIVYPESKSYFKHCNIQILKFQYFIRQFRKQTKTVSVKTLVAVFRFWNIRTILFYNIRLRS